MNKRPSEHWRNLSPGTLGRSWRCTGRTPWGRASSAAHVTTRAPAGHLYVARGRGAQYPPSFSLSVLNRAFTLYGFSPQLALIHDTRLTNAQAQDYDRNRAELRFVRQF